MAKQRAKVLVLCLCSLLLSAQPGHAKEKITYTPKSADKYEARPASCEIQVFKDSKLEQAYVELGIINYHDERHRMSDGELTLEVAMPKIKAYACKVGGHALMDIRITEVRRLEFAMFNVRATVVRFTAE
jgi:hypothetical protein